MFGTNVGLSFKKVRHQAVLYLLNGSLDALVEFSFAKLLMGDLLRIQFALKAVIMQTKGRPLSYSQQEAVVHFFFLYNGSKSISAGARMAAVTRTV